MSDTTRKAQHDRASSRDEPDSSSRETGRATRDSTARSEEAVQRAARESTAGTARFTEGITAQADEAKSRGEQTVHDGGRLARETLHQTEALADRGTQAWRAIGGKTGDTVAQSADAAIHVTEQFARQTRDLLLLGARTAAGLQQQLAGFGDGHGILGSTVRAFDIYRDAGERSAEHIHALVQSWLSLGRSVQQVQHAALERLDRALDQAKHRPQDMLRANSLAELAEIQRDVYLGAIEQAFESSITLLELATRAGQAAARPLQDRRAAEDRA